MNTIEVEACSFGYEDQPLVFRNVSFALKEGEILAIMGCNGVGKSTLLKCIAGLLSWKEGVCRINGKENADAKKSIGYVAQRKQISFPFRVRDLVCFGRSISNPYFAAPSPEDYRITAEVLDDLHITHLSKKLCTQLSGGELQMVFIAKALVSLPKILLLDEPETSLDIKNRLVLSEKLARLGKKYNTTILINSHDMNSMMQIATKYLFIGSTDYLFSPTQGVSETDFLKYLGVRAKRIRSASESYFILSAPSQEITL